MLTAEQIQQNWELFLGIIEKYISEPRKTKLIEFYKKYEERFILMPASYKTKFHNAFPGGYIDHVNRVVQSSLKLYEVWEQMGTDMTTFTLEELIFSAINHDLGKFGTEEQQSYIEQTDEWRRNKLNEHYMFNDQLEFMTVPDRSLFLLTSLGINYSKNEMLAIKLHDGIYDDANKPYFFNSMPELKPRTSLFFILHHADMMASRIEFEREWLPKLNGKDKKEQKNTRPTTDTSNSSTLKQSRKEERKQNELKTVIKNDVLGNFFK